MVSACLTGENCKYNGGNNRNKKILRLLEGNKIIAVCPEQMGGLPTPRVPSEIRDGTVMAKDGRNVDSEFRTGVAKCLEIARHEQPGSGCAAVAKPQLRSEAEIRKRMFRCCVKNGRFMLTA